PVPWAFVQIVDSQTLFFVSGVNTNEQGQFLVPLIDGTFLVRIEPWSLPFGATPPTPVEIVVSGDTITAGGVVITDLDLTVGQAAATVTVAVQDSSGFYLWTKVEVADPSSGSIVAGGDTFGAPTGISLPEGSFEVRVAGWSLPPGTTPPAPATLTVAADGSVTDSSGFPDDGYITLVVESASSALHGRVLLEGAPPTPLPGVRVAAMHDDGFEVASAFTAPDGSFSLNLPGGELDLEVTEGLPAGTVSPAPFLVRVLPDGSIEPPGTIDLFVASARGTLSGVVNLSGAGAQGSVTVLEPDGFGSFEEVTSVDTDSSGGYSVALPAGTFTAIAEIWSAPPLLIYPLPASIDVPSSGPPASLALDFAFEVPNIGPAPPAHTLTGVVTAGGVAFETEIIVLFAGLPMALVETSSGQYQLALQADAPRDFEVGVLPFDLPPGYTAPPFVAASVDGAGITGTGIAPLAGGFVLNFDVGLSGVVLHGAVQGADTTPFGGVQIASSQEPSGFPGPSTVSDYTGQYSLVFTQAGQYSVEVAAGLPGGLVRPGVVDFEVVDSGGVFSLLVGGSPSPDGLLDWTLEQGQAHLTGQLTLDGAPAGGEIIVESGGVEVSFQVVFGGTYDLYLPAGDLTITAELDGASPGVTPPPPFVITVDSDGVVDELAHDFGFTSS
ncbi:MAG: hypothetical protein HY721_33300, partial [Planctomycetes bacterium]|nr:hypothetical protein [Planctomycetota bacterium]